MNASCLLSCGKLLQFHNTCVALRKLISVFVPVLVSFSWRISSRMNIKKRKMEQETGEETKCVKTERKKTSAVPFRQMELKGVNNMPDSNYTRFKH